MLAMSELGAVDDSFLWENQSWGFSNSDNSGGSEEKSGKKMPDSSTSITQTPRGIQPAAAAAVVSGKKRSAPGVKKNEKGSGEVNEGGKEEGGGGGGGGGGESDHDIHIWTERERRKKMRNMFSNLHALLPQLPPKVDKSTIVDEAVNYIKTLQHTLQKLQKQKLERFHGHGVTTINYDAPMIITPQKLAMDSRESFLADHGSSTNLPITTTNSVPQFPSIFQTWTSPNVTLNVCGEEAHFSVCSTKKPGLLTAICYVLERHKLEVVSAHVSSDNSRSMYMIQAHASDSNQFRKAFPVEEIYKQAAGEIMFWVNS